MAGQQAILPSHGPCCPGVLGGDLAIQQPEDPGRYIRGHSRLFSWQTISLDRFVPSPPVQVVTHIGVGMVVLGEVIRKAAMVGSGYIIGSSPEGGLHS